MPGTGTVLAKVVYFADFSRATSPALPPRSLRKP